VQGSTERKEEEMVHNTLAYGGPDVGELLVVILVFGGQVGLIVWFARLLLRNRKENIRLRLEVGKLADELEQERRKSRGEQKDNSSGQSG
jgi:hypothetical protein